MRVAVPEEHANSAYAYVMAHYAKDIAQAAVNLSRSAFAHSKLSFREFEGARRLTAEINGCLICQGFRPKVELGSYVKSDGAQNGGTIIDRGPAPSEAFYGAVSQWRTSPIFSVRERLAMEYAEKLATDPQGIAHDDEFWSRMKSKFTDDEIVDLSCCIAGWMGIGRLTHALGLDAACSYAPYSAAETGVETASAIA